MGAKEDATIEKSRLKISASLNFVQIAYVASMVQGLKHHQKFSLISSLQWSYTVVKFTTVTVLLEKNEGLCAHFDAMH